MPKDQTGKDNTENTVAMSNSFIMEKMKGAVSLQKEFNADQLKFIKNLVNPDLTDSELYMFMALANRLQLDPFNREIIAVVYNKDKPADRKVNYIVTRDGKRVVASRQGGFEDIETETIYIKTTNIKIGTRQTGDKEIDVFDTKTERVKAWEGGSLWGAVCTITRNGKKKTIEVPLSEYNTGMNVWKSKPSTMIKKVAESQALSAAFPEILGGIYDESEMSSIQPASGETPAIAGGNDPATTEQIETIQNMGGQVVEGMTKQQAADTIKSLATPKK